jgi:hypothetical protein
VTDDPAASPVPDSRHHYVGDPAVQADWDRRYADREQLWSGRPNGGLVVEVAGMPPAGSWTSAAARAPTPSGWPAQGGT